MSVDHMENHICAIPFRLPFVCTLSQITIRFGFIRCMIFVSIDIHLDSYQQFSIRKVNE
jgi:hypothetical protein